MPSEFTESKSFKVFVWKQSLQLPSFCTVLMKNEAEVLLDERMFMPKDFDVKVLDASSKGTPLSEVFSFPSYATRKYIVNNALNQLGDIGKTASRIILELSPGVWTTVINKIGKLPEYFIYNDYEVEDLKGSSNEQKEKDQHRKRRV